MRKRQPVGVSVLFAFGRGVGLPLAGTSPSPYTQCSKVLAALGMPKADGESARSHCFRHEDFIRSKAAGNYKKRAEQEKQTTWKHEVSGVNVASDAFLETYEWRRVRMMALKKHGPVCMCCGASPATGAVMNVDHIKPRKLFPQLALDVDNLQILCHECNHGKGNWDMTDWRQVTTQSNGLQDLDPDERQHMLSIARVGWT